MSGPTVPVAGSGAAQLAAHEVVVDTAFGPTWYDTQKHGVSAEIACG